MVPVVGRDHWIAGKPKISLPELEDEEWLLFARGSILRDAIDAMFSRENFKSPRIYDSNDPAVIRELIRLGNGIGFLPSWIIESDVESGRIVTVEIGSEVNISLYIMLAENNRSQLVGRYIDFVLEKQISGVDLHDPAAWRK